MRSVFKLLAGSVHINLETMTSICLIFFLSCHLLFRRARCCWPWPTQWRTSPVCHWLLVRKMTLMRLIALQRYFIYFFNRFYWHTGTTVVPKLIQNFVTLMKFLKSLVSSQFFSFVLAIDILESNHKCIQWKKLQTANIRFVFKMITRRAALIDN